MRAYWRQIAAGVGAAVLAAVLVSQAALSSDVVLAPHASPTPLPSSTAFLTPAAEPSISPSTDGRSAATSPPPSEPEARPLPTASSQVVDLPTPLATVIASNRDIVVAGFGEPRLLASWEETCLRRQCAGTEAVAVRPGTSSPDLVVARRWGPAWNEQPCAGLIELVVADLSTDQAGTAPGASTLPLPGASAEENVLPADTVVEPVAGSACNPVWDPSGEALAWTGSRAPVFDPTSVIPELVLLPVASPAGVSVGDPSQRLRSGVEAAGEYVRVVDWIWTNEDENSREGYLVLQTLTEQWVRLWTRGVSRDARGRFTLADTAEPFPQPDLITVDAQHGDGGSAFYAVALQEGRVVLRIGGVPRAQSVIQLPRTVVDFIHPELAWIDAVGTTVLVGNGIDRAWRIDAVTGAIQLLPESLVLSADFVSQ